MGNGFKKIPNMFAPTEENKLKMYIHKHKMLKIQNEIYNREDDFPSIINIVGASGAGKTSTIKVLISKCKLDTFFVRFPIASLDFDDKKIFIKMKRILVEEIEKNASLWCTKNETINNPINIFLSYSRPDYDRVIPYYNKLEKIGFKPWIDKVNLLPGQDWNLLIEEAMRNAHFVILFISKSMTEKRGYIRKEIKQAIKYKDERLPKDIYLIPACLEECDIPIEIRSHTYANLYEHDGFDRLLQAIKYGCKERGIEIKSKRKTNISNKLLRGNLDEILSNIANEYPQVSTVIILDDFDYFFDSPSEPFIYEDFKRLLEKIVFDWKFKLILLSHGDSKENLINLSEKFENVKIIEYDLSEYEIDYIIEETRRMMSPYVTFQEGTLNDLIASTGGNYYCYQLLFDELINYLNNCKKNYVTKEDLNVIFDLVINSENRIDFEILWKSIPIAMRLFIVFAVNCENPCRFLHVSKISNEKIKKLFKDEEIANILNYLVERKYLSENLQSHISRYKISIPLYAKWIAKNYCNGDRIYYEFIEEIFQDPNISRHDLIFGSHKRSIQFTRSKEIIYNPRTKKGN